MAAARSFKAAGGRYREPENAFAITPADGADLASATRSIWVGVAGNIKVDLVGSGTGVIYPNVPAGRWVIAATRVYSTSTTATSLIGEY